MVGYENDETTNEEKEDTKEEETNEITKLDDASDENMQRKIEQLKEMNERILDIWKI